MGKLADKAQLYNLITLITKFKVLSTMINPMDLQKRNLDRFKLKMVK